MKIAIIGTHSTGKTTLVDRLKETFESVGKEVIVVRELARTCPLEINEETSLQAQKWILINQIEKENEHDHTEKILITDRATVDNFAYLHRVADPKTSRACEHIAFSHCKTYDHIFKTHKLDIEATADGVRTTDEAFRCHIDTLIDYFLKKNKIYYHTLLPTEDYDVHIRHILEKVNRLSPINAYV